MKLIKQRFMRMNIPKIIFNKEMWTLGAETDLHLEL